MKKDPKIFLQHILESIKDIETYTVNLSNEAFLSSKEKQDAIIRRIEIIGEAVTNLEEDFKKIYLNIPWQDMQDMRNKLIHGYFGVDLELVWSVVENDLPKLKEQIQKLLSELENIK